MGFKWVFFLSNGSNILLSNESVISLYKNGIVMYLIHQKDFFYRIIKENFCFEKYLDLLDPSDRIGLCRFRTCNSRLPIEVGRWFGIERSDKKMYIVQL